jgi:hypothetical protein
MTPENFRLTSSSFFGAEGSPVEHLRKEELINCKCGYMEEDGLMIQVVYIYSVGNFVTSMCILMDFSFIFVM